MQHLLDRFYRFEAAFAAAAYVVVTLALLTDIASREFFGHAILGIQRVAVYAAIAAGLIGLGLATHKGKHLRPKFTDAWLPQAWHANAARVGDALAFITYAAATYFACLLVRDSYQFGFLAPVLDWPIWYVQLLLPYTFLSTAVRHLAYVVKPQLRPQEEQQ